MHYDESYFMWQKGMGEIGGHAELFKFHECVNQEDSVLDFGCGGGFVLKNLNCHRRLGVEINPSAREYAKSQGVEVFESVEELPNEIIDVVISNHALEHVPSPFDVLTVLRRKVKSNARFVFVIPHDCMDEAWRENDINMHLYTWNSMTLGNLFVSAGYTVERVDVIRHCWPSFYTHILKYGGKKWFHRLGYLEAWLRRRYQVRVIARPNAMRK